MDGKINRKVVWVTGAGRGNGKEIAWHFAEIGCRVVLTSRSLIEQAVVRHVSEDLE